MKTNDNNLSEEFVLPMDNAQVNESENDNLDKLKEKIRASLAELNGTDEDAIDSEVDAIIARSFKRMKPDDYHNMSCAIARNKDFERAADLIAKGLLYYPSNSTLLGDAIKYCTEGKNLERASSYYAILKKEVDLRLWDWRAFNYSFDYLIASGAEKNENEARDLLKSFEIYFPHMESPRFLLAELEETLGNREEAMVVLTNTIEKLPNAAQCAFKLADYQMEHAIFLQLVNTCNYAIAAAAIPQESINTSYLVFLRTLAYDYLLHNKEKNGEEISESELQSVKEAYELLLSRFKENLRPYIDTIETRLKLLSFIRTNL